MYTISNALRSCKINGLFFWGTQLVNYKKQFFSQLNIYFGTINTCVFPIFLRVTKIADKIALETKRQGFLAVETYNFI